jgi:hypothetical protein
LDPVTIDQTLELLKGTQANPLQKAGITTGTGLVAFDLEPTAKLLYPVLTPLRNEIPRKSTVPGAGLALNWRIVSAINSASVFAGVSEGNRGGVISITEANKIATYKGLGLENSVTFEADYAARGFDDVKALAVRQGLESLMIAEEIMILNGNTSLALGTTNTPAGVGSTTGGTLAATTYFVYAVALTYDGYQRAGVAGGVVTGVAKTNADASIDTFGGGSAAVSAVSNTVTTTGSTGSIAMTVPATSGAFGYAWFWGTTTGTANATLGAVTLTNTFTITATATGTQLANYTVTLNSVVFALSADHSTNALAFDGLITQAISGGGYVRSLDGATLTADGLGGVVEIDVALKYMWDTFRISPEVMRVGGQCARDITKKILAGNVNPAYRVNVSQDGLGNLMGGNLVTTYLNKFALGGATALKIELHPYMQDGVIFFDTKKNPYPNSNVGEVRRIITRQEYNQTEWPLVSRKYQYGVYVDECLCCYIPQSLSCITNIQAG